MDARFVGPWAQLLTEYCLDVREGETILIAADVPAIPLVEACSGAIVLRRAHPLIRLELPAAHEFFLRNATEEQLRFVHPIQLHEAAEVDARIRISAPSDTNAMGHVEPRRQAIFDRSREPFRRLWRDKRWVVTQFPTPALADLAGMDLPEYETFVLSAMFLDRSDPVLAWKELGRRQAGLVRAMSGFNRVRIEADQTDLTLSVEGRTWINSDGRRNMPSGEIFTGPIEDSARGVIRCGFPVCRDGRRIGGIALEFEDGRVISARADQGEDYLLTMFELDEGARRLGELGLGLNEGIDRFTGTILFDEKIGGTIHLALGQSYPETGGVNQSGLHWDLIVDTRTGGRITADGRVVMEDGRWRIG